MPTRRTTNQTLLEELLAVQSWPVLLYDIQIMDKGAGTSPAANQFTCTEKAYDTNEWQTAVGVNDAVLTDELGNTFTIGAHAAGDTLTNLSGTPEDGDFVLSKWLYLASMPAEYVGSYTRITYNSKEYLPYPINHGAFEDHELGSFPQVSLNLYNPGTQIIDLYRTFEKYNGMRGSVVYITTVFVDTSGTIYADTDATIVDKFIINSSTITESQVVLEMQSTGNLSDKKIPARHYSKTTCDYVYKGPKCKYAGPITACNKLYSSTIIARQKCSHLGGEVFEVPSDVTLPGSDALVGCKVIVEDIGTFDTLSNDYIWEITTNTDTQFTTSSGSMLRTLSQYASGGYVVLSIIDKESCLGHTDTGRRQAPQWLVSEEDSTPRVEVEKGNLIVDGGFSRGYTAAWSKTTGGGMTIDMTERGVRFEKTTALQSGSLVQAGNYTYSHDSPERSQTYQFYMQYYGYTISGSPSTGLITIHVGFNYGGSYRWYNFDNQTWSTVKASQANDILLRTSDYKTDFSDDFESHIKPDEYSAMVYTNWSGGSSPYVASDVYLQIESSLLDNVRYACKIYRIGLFKYIPYEHAGVFTGIPTTRLWFV